MTNRRVFLSLAAGASVSSTLVRPLGALAADPPPTCTPFAVAKPYDGAPTPWTQPAAVTLGVRRPAWALSAAEVTRLRRAYAAMRALPASDGRSLAAQRNLHAYYCNGDAYEIHGAWTFLPWHRMLLYFHERILGALIDDPTFRLPYWDWETPEHQAPPPAYADPASNPLFDQHRFLQSGQSVQRWLTNYNTQAKRYYQLTLVHRLMDCTFDQFGGGPQAGGVVEAGAHGYVHVSAGGDATRYDKLPCSGDLAILNTAALDPLFYAHHTNLDRLWRSWEGFGANTNPGGDFAKLTFTFFDERGAWRSMNVAQMADVEHALGYRYETPIAPLMRAMPQAAPPRRIPLPVHGAPAAAAVPPAAIAAAKNPELALSGLVVPGSGDFRLSVTTARGTATLGDLFVVPHGGTAMHEMKPLAFNVCVALPPDSVSILLGGNLRFALEPSSRPAPRGLTAAALPAAQVGKAELILR